MPYMFLCSEGGAGRQRGSGRPSLCPFSPLERPAGQSRCSADTMDVHSGLNDLRRSLKPPDNIALVIQLVVYKCIIFFISVKTYCILFELFLKHRKYRVYHKHFIAHPVRVCDK